MSKPVALVYALCMLVRYSKYNIIIIICVLFMCVLLMFYVLYYA